VSVPERTKKKERSGGNNNYLLRARKLAATLTGILRCQYSWLQPGRAEFFPLQPLQPWLQTTTESDAGYPGLPMQPVLVK